MYDWTREAGGRVGLAVDSDAANRAIAELPWVKPLLELQLARFGVDRVETGAARMYKVLDHLIEADLQPIAQSYLTSVAQYTFSASMLNP